MSYPALIDNVVPGTKILVDDGVIELVVNEVTVNEIRCKIARGGLLGDHKGVNLPGTSLPLGSMSAENREDLQFAIEHDIVYIAASFVSSAEEVLEIRSLIEDQGASIPIIAKIENREGVENLDEIVAAANGTTLPRSLNGVNSPREGGERF